MDEIDLKPSKTQIKQEYKAFHALGKSLLSLSQEELQNAPLSESLMEAVCVAKKQTRSAFQRQLRFVANLVSKQDVEPIRAYLKAIELSKRKKTEAFHRVERWRDALVVGEEDIMDEIIQRYTDVDFQHLNQLVRNAQKELRAQSSPKAARQLFRYLTELEEDKHQDSNG